jgi:predicted NBD/HSP70 family sugar kinase
MFILNSSWDGSEGILINARELLHATSAKDQNRARVIRAVMVEPSPQNRLAQLTGLSEATVSTTVRSLIGEGVLRTEPGSDRSKWVTVSPDVRGAAVGVDVGYTHVTVAVRAVADTRLHTLTEPVGIESSRTNWVDAASDLIRDLLAEAGLSHDDIVSVGMATPGATDPYSGVVLQHVVPPLRNPADPPGDDPVTALSKALSLRVVADNDANLGAYAEFLHGEGRDSQILVYVKASHGVGAGIVLDGVTIRGAEGFAGELGHLTVDRNGPVCRCGNRGCLEAFIGERRLVDEVRAAYSGHTMWMPTSLESVIERARQGDPVDQRVLQDAGRHLGYALAQMSNLLNPDKIVIGGRLSQARDPKLMLDPLKDEFRQFALRRVREVPIVATRLGEEAQIRGAIALGLGSHRLADDVG